MADQYLVGFIPLPNSPDLVLIFQISDLCSPTIWLMAFNVYGFGVIMPIYCIVHLLSGGVHFGSSRTVSPSSVQHLRFLPLGITLGYIVPTFLSSWTGFLWKLIEVLYWPGVYILS